MLSPFNTIQIGDGLGVKDNKNDQATPSDILLQTHQFPNHSNLHLLLTITSLIIFDLPKNSIINRHLRDSESSIEKYGFNESVKLEPNGSIALLQTSKGYLFVYTLSTGSEIPGQGEEVLTVYDKSGKLLQNGNVIEYKQDQFFQLNLLETPVYKTAQLRLKLVLFIKNGIRDFVALSDNYLVLVTKQQQQQVQLMNLSTSAMNLIKFDEEVKKVKLLNKSDLYVIMELKGFRWYDTTSADGFKTFAKLDISVEDVEIINEDLIVAFSDCNLYYIEIVKNKSSSSSIRNGMKIIKTITLASEIKQISATSSLLAVLFKNKQVQIISKFGRHLHTIDSFSISQVSFCTNQSLILLKEDSSQLKHTDIWQFNGNLNNPILHNATSSYLQTYNASTNSFTPIPIPFVNHVSLNNASLHVRSNDKFLIVSNGTNFLMIYTSLDGIWDYFDLTQFRKSLATLKDFIILKNDWILINCDDKEIIVLDYFENRMVYQQGFSHSGCSVVLEAEGDQVLVGTQGRVYQFSYDSVKFKQEYMFETGPELSLERIIIWQEGFWLLSSTGEIFKYDTTTKTLTSLSSQFNSAEKLNKINQDYAIVMTNDSVHLLRRTNQPDLKIAGVIGMPFFLNFKKCLIISTDDSIPVCYNYLKDLIKLEISTNSKPDINSIYSHYKDIDSFQSTMEYLLYESVILNNNMKQQQELSHYHIKALIETNESLKIRVISSILRKIEHKQCLHILELFSIDSKYLLKNSLELNDLKNVLNLLIIFLSFEDITKAQLVQYLRLVFEKATREDEEKGDELIGALFETLAFLKKLDKELLKDVISELETPQQETGVHTENI